MEWFSKAGWLAGRIGLGFGDELLRRGGYSWLLHDRLPGGWATDGGAKAKTNLNWNSIRSSMSKCAEMCW